MSDDVFSTGYQRIVKLTPMRYDLSHSWSVETISIIKQNPRIDLSPQQATEYLANSPSERIFAKHSSQQAEGN